MRLFRSASFSAAAVTTFVLGACLFGAMIIMPLYFQLVRGEDAVTTGLLLIPQGIGAAIAMPLAGRFSDRVGGGRVALAGLAVTLVTTLPFIALQADTSYLLISAAMIGRGLGIGLTMMPAMTAAYSRLRPEDIAHATPQLNVLQRVGGSIGTALLTVVLQHGLTGRAHARGRGPAPSATPTCGSWPSPRSPRSPPSCSPARRAPSASARCRPVSSPRRRPRMATMSATRADVAVELREAVQAFTAAQRRLRGRDAKAGGTSFAQFQLLRRLAEVDECPASRLAADADLSPASVTQALDHLAELGLVERVRSEADRRVVLNRLTPAGRERFEAKRAALEERWKEALADLSAEQLGQAAQVLQADGRGSTGSERSSPGAVLDRGGRAPNQDGPRTRRRSVRSMMRSAGRGAATGRGRPLLPQRRDADDRCLPARKAATASPSMKTSIARTARSRSPPDAGALGRSATPQSATPAPATARSTAVTASTNAAPRTGPRCPARAEVEGRDHHEVDARARARWPRCRSTASSVSICTQQRHVRVRPWPSTRAGDIPWRACATNGPQPRVPAGG